jgi:hypothetical protein
MNEYEKRVKYFKHSKNNWNESDFKYENDFKISLFLIPTFENYGDEPMVDPVIVSETNLHYLVSLISFRKRMNYGEQNC